MSRKGYLIAALAAGVAAVWWITHRTDSRIVSVVTPAGVSRELAGARSSKISSVRYALRLMLPSRTTEPISGSVAIRFRLSEPSPVVLDFTQPAGHVSSVSAEGRAIPFRMEHGHLIVPEDALHEGENTIEVAFIAGDQALNRNDDYLYSLFVPARASSTFPCFDQPDLKASLALTLDLPSDWVAVANAPEIERSILGNRTTVRFGPTQALPTYLFGFAAGRFAVERGERGGRAFRVFHRETDVARVAANVDAIFDLHHHALEWLEDYTNRSYPFDKLDFVLLPAFQFAGMEHAGAVYYNAPALWLDKTATQEQHLSRANLIAHETAHMWFGNLVTMKWFDDVWLKEVFANFIAAKVVNPSFPSIDHELRFLLQHYPSAYNVDRSAGANPIRQPLENLTEAGSLYGPIIYDKAPIVMRQLEAILGPDALQSGLREYLQRFAFSNATWTELIAILDARTSEDLAAWSRMWVDEPGRPTVAVDMQRVGGAISRMSLSQTDPSGRARTWPQQLHLALGYEHGARISTVNLHAPHVAVAGVRGLPVPQYVLPNGEASGYGLFQIDAASKTHFLNHLPAVGDAVTRATAWLTLWDDMLEGGTAPLDILRLAMRALPEEVEEQNVELVLGYVHDIFWRFLTPHQRTAAASNVERVLLSGMTDAGRTSLKSAYFGTFRRVVTSREGVARLERIWRGDETIAGLPFAETDYINMAQDLAVRDISGAKAILEEQLARIQNPDRKARFAFILPALAGDTAVRDQFFAGLAQRENRAREPWVIDALRYLNHPLRRPHAEVYVQPALALLADVQRTGDIFFPSRWTAAVLNGHNSPAAAATVKVFLAQQNDYPPRLRQIIEQSADQLYRAARVQSP